MIPLNCQVYTRSPFALQRAAALTNPPAFRFNYNFGINTVTNTITFQQINPIPLAERGVTTITMMGLELLMRYNKTTDPVRIWVFIDNTPSLGAPTAANAFELFAATGPLLASTTYTNRARFTFLYDHIIEPSNPPPVAIQSFFMDNPATFTTTDGTGMTEGKLYMASTATTNGVVAAQARLW